MHDPPLISPRGNCSRIALTHLALFLSFPWLACLMVADAAAGPVDIEVGAGIFLPGNDTYYSVGTQAAPQFNLGLRRSLLGKLNGRLTLDFGYTHDAIDPISETTGIHDTGEDCQLFQWAINIGTRFKEKPNVFAGLGRYYLWYSDLTTVDYSSGTRTSRRARAGGAIIQFGLTFDMVKASRGDVYFMARGAGDLRRRRGDVLDYWSFIVGYRFHS